MAFEALTLAIVSPIHLIEGSDEAGFAEGLICIALLIGLTKGRRALLAAVAFAIFGFIVGLTSTVRDGGVFDLAYHAVMLPILIGTAMLLRKPRRERAVRLATAERSGVR